MLTVHELRKRGYKVRVIHSRVYYYEHYCAKGNGVLQQKGGNTHVEITTPDNINISGTAFCSDKDNYNRKLGVKIALGRALKYLGLPTK